jgi:hypothetical protein
LASLTSSDVWAAPIAGKLITSKANRMPFFIAVPSPLLLARAGGVGGCDGS